MKTNRKIFALVSLLVLASMVLAACGGGATEAPATEIEGALAAQAGRCGLAVGGLGDFEERTDGALGTLAEAGFVHAPALEAAQSPWRGGLGDRLSAQSQRQQQSQRGCLQRSIQHDRSLPSVKR